MILLAIASVSAVSAGDNATDAFGDADTLALDASEVELSDDVADETLGQEVNEEELSTDEKAASSITSSDVTGYESFNSDLTFKLTSDSKALAYKQTKTSSTVRAQNAFSL